MINQPGKGLLFADPRKQFLLGFFKGNKSEIIFIPGIVKYYQNNLEREKAMSNAYTRKKIQNYSYGLNDVIGKGYSSQVYKGRNDETSESVAVKVIDLRMLKNEINRILLDSEILILKELKSLPHILALHEVFTTKNNTYIITELCDSDLNKAVKKGLTQPQACAFMHQIITGYLNFARKQIVHRDLKPANILITEGQELKVADFGFAIKLADAAKSNKYNVGSPLYMAPESLKRNEYSLKTDIWALGVIFFEMLTGETPWKAKNEKELIRKIESEKIEDILGRVSLSNMSKQFLRRSLRVDKFTRLEIDQLTEFNFAGPSCNNILGEKKLNLEPRQNQSTYQNMTTFTPKIEKSVDNRLYADRSCENKAPARDFSQNKFNSYRNDSINQSLQLKPGISHKYSPSVNLDLKKKESNKSTKQNPEIEASPQPNLVNKSQNRNEKKLVSKILVCEIHFCRFLYKLLTKIMDSNKRGLLQHSRSEVESIIWDYVGIIKHKIENIINFSTNNFLNTSIYEEYKECNDYLKLMKIAKEYKDRYSNEVKQYWSSSTCSFSTENTLNLIAQLQRLLTIREYQDDFILDNSKEIIILDYLITSKQLIQIFKNGENYEKFAKKSRIEDIVQGKTADISRDLYSKIMNRAKQVTGTAIPCMQVQFEHKAIMLKA